MSARKKEEKNNRLTIAGVPAVDWLTLTSKDYRLYDVAVLWLLDVADANGMKVRPASKEQYRGQLTDCGFCGVGEQSGILDFMVVVSGGWAYEFFRDCSEELLKIARHGGGVRCSRIDVQITRDEDVAVDFPSLAERIRGMSARRERGEIGFIGRGKIPDVTTHHSPTGSTLEIGSRMSENFVRIYQKLLLGLIRFEVEYKGKLAKSVALELIENWSSHQEIIARIIGGETKRYPLELRRFIADTFKLDDGEKVRRDIVTDDIDKTWEWFQVVILPVITKLSNSKYRRDMIVNLSLNLGYSLDKGRSIEERRKNEQETL